MGTERKEIGEDITRAKAERRMKEESQLLLAKHEAALSLALARAAEDKLKALEEAGTSV